MTRPRRRCARSWLTCGRSARGDSCRSRCGNGLRHGGRSHGRRGCRHRGRRLGVDHHWRRGQRGRETAYYGRARQVDPRIARKRSGYERVRAVGDREPHTLAAGTPEGPGAYHSRATRGAHRTSGAGRGGRRARSRCGHRGRAMQARHRHLREVNRGQRQRRNRDRCRWCVDRGANRAHPDDRVWERDRGRTGDREPEPHTPGTEAADAERASAAGAMRSGGGRS